MSKYQEMLDDIKWHQEKYKDKDGNAPNPIFEIMLFEYPNKEMIYHKPNDDIQETCYHAGFILCRFPGLYQAALSRMYFLWNEEKKGFFEAEEPEIFKHVAY